ncbi:MAG: hypothetical protein BMS9Abin37_3263 [Acidobacteriota bacterium]|nr:MAG: hypothetical protein BMS9Abin37_3263 [Acidobacteriota bacterium]
MAGAAEGRDQKVHNLLAALDEVEPTDVWAFADSAGRPDREWFRRLVAMLTQPDVRVASTNRFYVTPIEWRGRVYEMRSSSEIVIVR